jgi:hypothetical protein
VSTTKCHDCGAEPSHPGSVVRLVGKDASGNTVALCSRCFIARQHDVAPALPKLEKKKKTR